MHVSGCLGCLDILRTLLTSLPLWLAVQPTWNLSHLSSFNHLELLKASLIVYCPDTCYQLETFNSPCLLLSAVHSLPVLTCIQQYWMLLPPPTSDVNPPPQFLCSVSWGAFPLSLKMEQQCFLSLVAQTSSISPVFPRDGTCPSNREIQHCQQFTFYAQEVPSGYWMGKKNEKKKGTSVAGHKHHSITCHPKNQVQK